MPPRFSTTAAILTLVFLCQLFCSSCEETRCYAPTMAAFDKQVAEVAEKYKACETDSDCHKVDAVVSCINGHPVFVNDAERFASDLDELGHELCECTCDLCESIRIDFLDDSGRPICFEKQCTGFGLLDCDVSVPIYEEFKADIIEKLSPCQSDDECRLYSWSDYCDITCPVAANSLEYDETGGFSDIKYMCLEIRDCFPTKDELQEECENGNPEKCFCPEVEPLCVDGKCVAVETMK